MSFLLPNESVCMSVPHEPFTLSAGPALASHRTLAAFAKPVQYHYDPEFIELFRRTQTKAAELLRTRNDVLIMQGEAIAALEGAIRSLAMPGMKVLNLVQGVFGKGTGYWLKDIGAEVHEIEVGYNDAVSPEAVEEFLRENPDTGLVTMVHCETPSGTMGDCAKFGPIAKKYGALTMVDAVSSVGASEFLTDDWGIDIAVVGGQKCLAGPTGVSIASVSDAAWEHMAKNPHAPRATYISLLDWKEKWLDQGSFPFTPAVTEMYGLEAAIDQVLEEGLDAVIARHHRVAAAARAGVRAMGLELWAADDSFAAPCVTAVKLPDSLNDLEVRAHIREKYGVMMSTGQGAGNLVRIAHMGPSANIMYLMMSLTALGQSLRDLGLDVNVGAGVEAALEQHG